MQKQGAAANPFLAKCKHWIGLASGRFSGGFEPRTAQMTRCRAVAGGLRLVPHRRSVAQPNEVLVAR